MIRRLLGVTVLSGALIACASSPEVKPSSTTVGSPMSNFCANPDPCPGISKEKLKVCGSCDPKTRHFRQSVCSMDEKLRTSIDSCMKGKGSLTIKGEDIFGGQVSGCVKQKLENEQQLVDAFVKVAKDHKATDEEQKAWRTQCDRLWSEHTKRKHGAAGAARTVAPESAGE